MLISIASNYVFGFLIHYAQSKKDGAMSAKLYLAMGLGVNLLLLTSFKYANFITDNVNDILALISISPVELAPVHLPLGISFFTFQAISYIVDIYRKEVPPQTSIINFALYISLFPQLIAGPIVRYKDIAEQIIARKTSTSLFAQGAQRFIYGLAKKTLIANALGEVADTIFAMPAGDLSAPLAWIGIIAYALQIYFDFSGYSDMAIGLGLMFGFRFLENFNYPYISKSIREFWRRWHISLSTWFRDYVYIALGGNRVSRARVYVNLLIVFILTGFWHGASWNFLIWGLFHGAFLACEHAGFSKILNKLWLPLQHAYVLLIVLVGWVFFRAETLTDSLYYIAAMFDVTNLKITGLQYAQIFSHEAAIAMVIGLALALPVYPKLKNYAQNSQYTSALSYCNIPVMMGLFYMASLKVASSTYDPFIYFRF